MLEASHLLICFCFHYASSYFGHMFSSFLLLVGNFWQVSNRGPPGRRESTLPLDHSPPPTSSSQYFFKVAIPMGCILILFESKTHMFVISDVFALWRKRAATFQCSDVTPPSCRAEPASPWHLVRGLASWHPQLQLPCTPLQACDPWVYAVFEWELYSHGLFISHEATLNSS